MNAPVPIGEAARLSGLPIRTIRFYEDEGVVTSPTRNESGRRLYDERALRELRLAANARNIGLPLPAIRELVANAFAGGCRDHATRASTTLRNQFFAIDLRIAELNAARAELQRLANEATLVAASAPAGQRVEDCPCCLLIEETGGSPCTPAPTDKLRIPEEALEILACEIGVRPAGGPGPFDLAPDLRLIVRSGQDLRITFRDEARDRVAAFVAAEQACCGGIGWELSVGSPPILTVTASPAQLDIVETSFREGQAV